MEIDMKDKDGLLELCEKIKWLREPEFGDFKRKIGLYLDQANENFTHPQAKKSLEELKYQVVYAPNGDMEATRALVVSKLKNTAGSIHSK